MIKVIRNPDKVTNHSRNSLFSTCLLFQVEKHLLRGDTLSSAMGCPVALSLTHLAYLLSIVLASERRQHHVQHGPCRFTFVLPEVEHCRPSDDHQVANAYQRDSAPETSQPQVATTHKDKASWQDKKLQNLESAMENNTQWLQKVPEPEVSLLLVLGSNQYASGRYFYLVTFKQGAAQKEM